ncbi:hypothetical protein ACJMK2_004099, partial [Sinanodonta woodiana]
WYDSRQSSSMVLKGRKYLSRDMRYIISNPELCDVIFLVGPERTPVYGLRAILSARS